MDLAWTDIGVDPAELRRDTDAMAEAVAHALIETLPRGSIRGLYFKGSAAKPWESPVDYVADLSDVDIHLWLGDTGLAEGLAELHDLTGGLRRHELVERRFRELRPTPLHTPRVQVVLLNELLTLEGYVPSPASTVRTLHGEPYASPHDIDPATLRRSDAANARIAADPAFIAKAVGDLVEAPGRHLFALLRALSWRVSPVAQRVLTLRGAGYAEAWGVSRTTCLRRLVEVGETGLAADLATYYASAWRAQRSGWTDPGAGRDAFAAAVRSLERARAVADEVHPEQPKP